MPFAMTREERHALACQRADADRARGRSVFGDGLVGFGVLQLGQGIDAGAADQGEVDGVGGHWLRVTGGIPFLPGSGRSGLIAQWDFGLRSLSPELSPGGDLLSLLVQRK